MSERNYAPRGTPVLEARDLRKRYGHVEALRGADFVAYAGQVVCLVGDNGAGKSTLVRALSGVERPDSGALLFQGAPATLHKPGAARRMGIETVYQDLALAEDLDCAANVYLGREIRKGGVLGRVGFLDRREMRRRTVEEFERLGVGIGPTTRAVSGLSGGQKQSVAVARAAMWASAVVFLDEPTAALAAMQTQRVLDLVRRLADTGLAVVLISHDLPQVVEVADQIEVLRLGRRVAHFVREEATTDLLLAAMTGAYVQSKEAS
ncbi:MAG TPA: ATP-binding cassette domain-containing protein [Trebonia sp.]|jgi:simple sugar transport system ATP-binding protein|nr:ATP-binding cassette domain-containing protein [Trebonia sp.]